MPETEQFNLGEWRWVTAQGERQPAKLSLVWRSPAGDAYFFALAGQSSAVSIGAQFIGPVIQ